MIGSVARVPPTIAAGRVTQDTVKLEFREHSPDFAKYLYWLLRTPHYREYCAGRAIGTTAVALKRTDFLAYPVPPLTTQSQHLVANFEAIDEKIELDRHMNRTLSAQRRETVSEECQESSLQSQPLPPAAICQAQRPHGRRLQTECTSAASSKGLESCQAAAGRMGWIMAALRERHPRNARGLFHVGTASAQAGRSGRLAKAEDDGFHRHAGDGQGVSAGQLQVWRDRLRGGRPHRHGDATVSAPVPRRVSRSSVGPRFTKYQRITVDVSDANDPRPESLRPNLDTLRLGDKLGTGRRGLRVGAS